MKPPYQKKPSLIHPNVSTQLRLVTHTETETGQIGKQTQTQVLKSFLFSVSYPGLSFSDTACYTSSYLFLVLICVTRPCNVPRHVTA